MRRPDWPERLDVMLSTWRHRPFRWGQSDCVHFARDVLSAVRCEEWAVIEWPPYTTWREAYCLLSDYGFVDLSAAVTAVLGEPVSPTHAQRGDLIALPTSFGAALGVCLGATVASVGRHGLVLCPLNLTIQCWRV